ncbi:hypothetical protein [Solobacterium moorei]|uniref:hypothetical protein n=1 Tax=Solobacterium moorei TaxID=102148 RepID=UPI0028E704CC|nr:hypothetical protein [Solobacterium moorei]
MRNKSGLFKQIISFLTALVVMCGMVLPSTITANAANALPIAQYITVSGTVSGVAGSNNGTYNGEWKASIPMADVMSAFETEMRNAASAGQFPWDIETVSTSASIYYDVTFPAGATIGTPTISSTTSIIPASTITSSVAGNTVKMKFKLADVNWQTIANYYDAEKGTANHTVDITIPYTVSANGYGDAKNIDDSKQITSSGYFAFYPSGSWGRWGIGKQTFNSDKSTLPLTADFATSTVFAQPSVSNSSATVDVDADLMLDSDTGTHAITKQKTDALNFVGVFHAKTIKDQMASIEASYSAQANQIGLSNLQTQFKATINLPAGVSFTDIPSTANTSLEGSNGSFVVSDVTGDAHKATVTFELVNANNITSFSQLKDAVNAVDDDMKVRVPAAKFDADSVGGTDYEITGEVSGGLTATATNNVSWNVINFDLKWNGKQIPSGASVNNPSIIALSVNYPAPIEKNFNETLTLPGDILVGTDTQHDHVYEAAKDAKIAFTGSLDVSSVKTQMRRIEDTYHRANVDPTTIALTNYNSEFIATLTLPDEMDFDTNPTVSLLHDNGKYRIISQTVSGKTITVKMTVAAPVTTFVDLKDAVLGMDDTLDVTVNGAHFNNSAKPNTNYTVRGAMAGQLAAKATDVNSGNVVNFVLKWNAEQSPSGADSTNPTSTNITFTLKYLDTTTPEVAKSNTPKTGDTSNLSLYIGAVIVAFAAFGFTITKRFKLNK